MLPPIRYPLPTLVLLLVLGLLAWRGESMTRPWRSALAEQLASAIRRATGSQLDRAESRGRSDRSPSRSYCMTTSRRRLSRAGRLPNKFASVCLSIFMMSGH